MGRGPQAEGRRAWRLSRTRCTPMPHLGDKVALSKRQKLRIKVTFVDGRGTGGTGSANVPWTVAACCCARTVVACGGWKQSRRDDTPRATHRRTFQRQVHDRNTAPAEQRYKAVLCRRTPASTEDRAPLAPQRRTCAGRKESQDHILSTAAFQHPITPPSAAGLGTFSAVTDARLATPLARLMQAPLTELVILALHFAARCACSWPDSTPPTRQ